MNIYGLGGLYGIYGGSGYGSLISGNLGIASLISGNSGIANPEFINYDRVVYGGLGGMNLNYLSSYYAQNGVVYDRNGVYLNPQTAPSDKTEKHSSERTDRSDRLRTQRSTQAAFHPSFQHVLAASIKGQNFAELLETQYPGVKCQVMDTSKIDASLWQRNDYPFEKFFEEQADTSILDWKPSAKEPSMTDGKVQARLNAARGKYAVILPAQLEEKLEGNTALAQNILGRISTLLMQQDTKPSTIDSFSIALDEDGNIANYRFSGGGGNLILPYGTVLKNNAAQKTSRAQTHRHL